MSFHNTANYNLALLLRVLIGFDPSFGQAEVEATLTAASQRRLRLLANACCRRIASESREPEVHRALAHSEEIAEGAEPQPWLTGVSGSFDTLIHAVDSAVGDYLTAHPLHASDIEAIVAQTYKNGDSEEERVQAALVRDVLVNPFHTTDFAPAWRTDTAVLLARQMYESRDFSAMPILADALQDSGCDSDDILDHCRDPQQVHVRGCWVVDLVLGKS